ncbi:MAG: hypothetical protein K6F33_02540 [Bacteroidales bacterium]|nr:hypothetical protein [Bacteroidales bacterium]
MGIIIEGLISQLLYPTSPRKLAIICSPYLPRNQALVHTNLQDEKSRDTTENFFWQENYKPADAKLTEADITTQITQKKHDIQTAE